MKSNAELLLELAVSFLPFILLAFLNSKVNVAKENRYRQYLMPVIVVIYSVLMAIFQDSYTEAYVAGFLKIADLCDLIKLSSVADAIRSFYTSLAAYLDVVLYNTGTLLQYIVVKRVLISILGRIRVRRNTFIGSVVELFYAYDESENRWYIKEHFGQACTFIKTAYYGSCFVTAAALMLSCGLYMNEKIDAIFCPVFAIIIIGELAFFVDGQSAQKRKSDLTVQADNARRLAMYPLLRKPLKAMFGDKLSAEGTTVNSGGMICDAVEDILVNLEQTGGHVGKNYAAFIRKKMESGLKPNTDYVRCGYDLAVGKSLLFNTPFYDKLNPYVFYAMNRELLKGGKILVVLGRHGTEEDLRRWCASGMKSVSNIPDIWKTEVLSGKKLNEDALPDIGIISRSGVHDLDIHKNNLPFLRKVSFVMVIEPSRLVTTAQIGLNLLIKCCGKDRAITFCSVDRNCDGLVDALSHILMTNITEVSATEYPHGMSSYMYWTADDDYLQHRILPGVSRFLGMGTEISIVALKNQVKKAIWYGGEAFPVLDTHWIAKQYYYNLLAYAQLPKNQETFDKCFQASFNMCDERVSDYSFITVEDDRNNLFETRRNFATIAEKQGFVNVISSEYMLREYMSANTEVFTADAKAIPYITADYARTKRNAILSLCLLMCIDSVKEEVLHRQMVMLNIDTKDPVSEIWREVCVIFGNEVMKDAFGTSILSVKGKDGKTVRFEKDSTILFKRAYSIESGKFESVYTIDNSEFSRVILDDLQNASYIAEQENKDVYIGTELKGHVYQKYMPGQMFTLNGKYYEMVSTTTDNRILVRRASEHIGGRLAYRQVRKYAIHHIENSNSLGALKSVNNIGIHYQYADLSAETLGYWKLRAYNDFDNGALVKVNGVPIREYHHKQVLKFDFSKYGDAFTDSVRMTLTNLLNEVFVTLFADNQAFISAVTPGQYDAPLTYSLTLDEGVEGAEKSIYIIEDSQLDIGLLIAVERNVNRIMQIIADYLAWNEEQINESIRKQNVTAPEVAKTKLDDCLKPINRKREEKAAAKRAARAEKLAAREQKKALKQEEKRLKQQRKAAKKEVLEAVKKDAEPVAQEENVGSTVADAVPAVESIEDACPQEGCSAENSFNGEAKENAGEQSEVNEDA